MLLRQVVLSIFVLLSGVLFFFQAEDGIRDLVRSRGLGDVYKRQGDDAGGDAGAMARDQIARQRLPGNDLAGQRTGLELSLIQL